MGGKDILQTREPGEHREALPRLKAELLYLMAIIVHGMAGSRCMTVFVKVEPRPEAV